MEPVLSKQEVADLLSAIRAGEVPLDNGSRLAADYPIDCTPLSLFELAQQREDRVRIPNMDVVLDSFCRNYSISLSNQLQRTFSISRISLETFEYGRYLTQRQNPGSVGLIKLLPLQHSGLIIFDRQLSYSMIEVMLGASNELDPVHLERPLTTIELSILRTAMQDACLDIDKSFRPITQLRSTLVKVENNMRLVSIAGPDSEVLVSTFKVEVDDLSGEIDLVIPTMSLDPLREKLRELLMVETATRDTWQEAMENELKQTSVELTAQSGIISLTVDKILRLKEGDIVPIDYDPNLPLKVLVEGRLKFGARSGTSDGKKAISITDVHL